MDSMIIYTKANRYLIVERDTKRPKEASVYETEDIANRKTWLCIAGTLIRFRNGTWHPYQCDAIINAQRLSPLVVAALLR